MSIYGALYAGVAGLQAQSNKLGVLSDNIANVNTVGYKSVSSQFSTLVVGSGTGAYSPGGVLGGSTQNVTTQGLLSTTSSPTDIAIAGGGFFVVNQKADQSGQVLYTRAGSFVQDSQGNFANSSGLYLQAWPLDRNGNLPGAPGNLNTTSSANLSSLQTVNVASVTGSASPTTAVSLGANLDAGQSIFLGAGATLKPESNDPANYNTKATDIIVPTGVDSLTRGDKFGITTGVGQSYTYTYGGFALGRDVTNGVGGDAGTTLLSSPTTLNNTPLTPTALTPNAVGSDRINVTVGSTANLRDGDIVTISGAAAFDNFLVGDLNGAFQIVVDSATQFHYSAANATVAAATTTNGGALGTATPNPIGTTSGSKNLVISLPNNRLKVGDLVSLSGVTAPSNLLNNIPISEINTSFIVKSVNADGIHFTVQVATTSANANGGGGAGTISCSTRPFQGDILDAQNPSQSFLGLTGTSKFLSTALSFTIGTSASGTKTFTYTPTAPNAALGQFNNLNNLAAAIDAVSGLTARVATVGTAARLYVGAEDANAAVAFVNGTSVGSDATGTALGGIDWINELGLADVTIGTNRYSSLSSLSSLIDSSPGLTSTIENPTSSADLKINLTNPLDTIQFADDTYGGGHNTGSPLAAFGLITTLSSVAPSAGAGASTASLGPAYDPTSSTTNMASGAVAAQFNRPISVYDSLGTSHTLNVAFLKTDSNTWQVEIYAQPASDVSTSLPNGQIANGTIVFNGDGTLQSVSGGLSPAGGLDVNWTNGSSASSLTYNFGTAGRAFGSSGTGTIGTAVVAQAPPDGSASSTATTM